jgi:hypothetical protein
MSLYRRSHRRGMFGAMKDDNSEYKHDDEDLYSADFEVDYIARMRFLRANFKNNLRGIDILGHSRKGEPILPWDNQPSNIQFSNNISRDPTMALMRDWMGEKNNEIEYLKARLQEQHQELIQREIDLAVLRLRFTTQIQMMENELMIMKYKLSREIDQNHDKDVFIELIQANTCEEDNELSAEKENLKVDNNISWTQSKAMNSNSEIPTKLEYIDSNEQSLSSTESTPVIGNPKNIKKDSLPITKCEAVSNTGVNKKTKSETSSFSSFSSTDSKSVMQQELMQKKDPALYPQVHSIESKNAAAPPKMQVQVYELQSQNAVLYQEDISSIDTSTVGTSVASSTHHDDRKFVQNLEIMDPYGDIGQYSGVILSSTRLPHGVGRMLYNADGRIYNGRWRHGRWHGYGKTIFANRDYYEGEFYCDQRHGQGKYEWSNGRVYVGEFQNDRRQGTGTFTWPDGAMYVGDFVDGKREGRGRYTFPHGGFYDGYWENGFYHGQGGKIRN